MREKAALGVDDPRLAGDDAPPAANCAPFGTDAARVLGDRSGEIGLGLNCHIARASWQQRVGGAAGRAVDEGQRPAAVHDPQRVQEVRPRVALEHGKAVADLGQPERQRLSDRRRRQLAVEDRLEKLPARHQPGFGRIGDAVSAPVVSIAFLLSMQIQIMYLHTLMPRPKQPLQETLVADVRAAVDACAGWNARLAARRITGFLNRRMQDSSLSLAQFGLIAQIASARDDTLSELAQRTGLDQSTLSRNLQVLEAAGLVEMAAGDRDARRRAVWLTEKGAKSLEAGLADWKRAHGELAKRLDPEAARRLAVAAEALEEG